MTALLYAFFILPLSKLPLTVLYRFSDLLFLITFYGVGYRKKVIRENIARAFPGLSETERGKIARDFYRHFCDLVFESVRSFSISDEEVRKRFHLNNPEVLSDAYGRRESIVLVGGHYGNWEWLAMGLPLQMQHQLVAIYKSLSNPFFDRKMRETRGRTGLELVSTREISDFFQRENARVIAGERKPFIVGFGFDQSPGDPRKAHWIRFLGLETGVVFGAEKLAKEYGLPVYYGIIRKRSRGYYDFTISPLVQPPHVERSGWILEQGMRLLESEIRKKPAYWLWSHRRWKHAKPSDRTIYGE